VGVNNATKQVHIINFGSAKLFRHPRTYTHIPFCDSLHFTGTASINAHLGIEISQHDDMESLAYILIYFLHGSLPWVGLGAGNQDVILQSKQGSSIEDLCYALPTEFASFLIHACSLAFEDKPDYDGFWKIFEALLLREGPADANMFDWDQLVGAKRSMLEGSKQETCPKKQKPKSRLANDKM
jgi:casein kinase I family protein HRR25